MLQNPTEISLFTVSFEIGALGQWILHKPNGSRSDIHAAGNVQHLHFKQLCFKRNWMTETHYMHRAALIGDGTLEDIYCP